MNQNIWKRDLLNTAFDYEYPFRHHIKTKTRKITQTPYRLKIDDRIHPDSTIKFSVSLMNYVRRQI
jgi:hypothetical protein